MDVFSLRNKVIGDYGDYVTSFVEPRDQRIADFVHEEMQRGALWPDPLVQLNPAFEPGPSIDELVAEGTLHEECRRIFADKGEDGHARAPLRFHKHQVDAFRAARRGDHYVLTTGTGSGKSLSYIVPIVDHVLRRGSGQGIQAIVVYPMNALANSQILELQKYLERGYPSGHPPVTFRRYTGQDRDEQRKEIIAKPPDILLTNYVMLELVLTRPWEHQLIAAADGLRFLVLDELHTYRGRQGADVAMLVRRMREACRAQELLHVGTSATLSSAGSWDEQRAEVASVASTIFGVDVKPEGVIGETLRRVTPPLERQPDFADRLRDVIERGDTPPTSSPAAFAEHPLAVWIETELGLREKDGRLVRCVPSALTGEDGAGERLGVALQLPADVCVSAISKALLAGYAVRDPLGRPLFAFRLHQFVSKGDAVYASPEVEESRHLTLAAQQFVPGSDRTRVLLPLAFCRECGHEYYLVRRGQDADGRVIYIPRDIGERIEDDDGEPGFLHIHTADPWPDTGDALLDRLPETWIEEKRGQRVVKKTRRAEVPRTVSVSSAGVEGAGDIRAQWMPTPFRFCLHCGVTYGAHQQSDFGKLATLGSEGRSTATTIMSLSAMRRLRAEPDLKPEARKLLSFTDNRQDASLQAGHFNDFVEITLLRSALAKAVRDAGSHGVRHDQLTHKVFESLSLPLPLYASNPNVEFLQREETDRALRSVLGYYLYRDLRRGWRITSPNLEQCGLLQIDYLSLGQFCEADARWAAFHPVLAGADPHEREHVCRALLDFMRRELAIRVDYLTAQYQETIEALSSQYLIPPWALDDMQTLERSAIVVPGSRGDANAPADRMVYISARGGLGMLVRRKSTFESWQGDPLKVEDSEQIIRELLAALVVPGIVQRVLDPRDGDDPGGFQVNASALVWCAGDGAHAFHDPVRVPNAPAGGLRANPFFVDYYRADTADLKRMEAREHTAQVPSQVREEREERFRRAALPVLYCSPTMELGVDIASLNVVNMRNVPPTPANYAQRSGRAGRSGQPAFVLTYCSVGSPHDQYFFRNPEQMVAGAVTTPRLDLANDDLLRAHVHAVWLGTSKLSLGQSLSEVLDVSGDEPTLELLPKVKGALDDLRTRDAALVRARAALAHAIEEVLAPSETTDEWIRRVLDQLPRSFDEACERWRSLYRAALTQSKRQQRIVLDASRSPQDRAKAARLRAEAEAQLRLLLEVGEEQHSDFYSYRYFASEGFLPGYNFPRLPLSAFLAARRGSQGRDEFLTRPRFLAITEFGPRSIIYHEGSRYVINKVIVPVDADGASIKRRGVQCRACGYLHPLGDEPAPDLCEHCGAELPHADDNLFRMQNVATRRRDRINSDEEERFRLGYEVKTGLRFASRNGIVSAQEAEVVDDEGKPLARLVYGNAATLWRINLGWRRRQNKDQTGFQLDVERGYWAKNQVVEEDPDDELSTRVERVIPYVEDRRNALVLIPAQPLDEAVMASLQAALKTAIQIHFQLEDRELAAEPLPTADVRTRVLFYESSEGGAGVLRRLVEDSRALGEVARQALRLCHFDPATLEDRERPERGGERCDAACYDCLRSYYNQRDHQILDRKLLPQLLSSLAVATVRTSPRIEPRQEHVGRLKRLAQSQLERDFIDLVDRRGLKLPSDAQVLIEACGVRPDFLYRSEGAAIFVDGPHHDDERQQQNDRAQADRLEDNGHTVIRFHHAADWLGILRRYPSVFGHLASMPPPGTSSTPSPTGVDLSDFDDEWHPLLSGLAQRGAEVAAVGDVADAAGRVVGTCLAEATRTAKTVFLIDARDPDAERVESVLLAQGRATVRISPSDAVSLDLVDAALGATKAGG